MPNKLWDTKAGFWLDMMFHALIFATFVCLAIGLGSAGGPSA
jgi:hypothetical protein